MWAPGAMIKLFTDPDGLFLARSPPDDTNEELQGCRQLLSAVDDGDEGVKTAKSISVARLRRGFAILVHASHNIVKFSGPALAFNRKELMATVLDRKLLSAAIVS